MLQLIRLQFSPDIYRFFGLGSVAVEATEPTCRAHCELASTRAWPNRALDFWWQKLLNSSSSKPISSIRIVTNPGILRTRVKRVRLRLWSLDHCIALLYIGNTIVTGTCWIRPARPLSTITLVAHPGGENHELDISYTNHELVITESALLPQM